MKKILAFLAVVLLSATVRAQTFPDGNVVYLSGTADPVGSCVVGTEFYRTDTGVRFSCVDGTWTNYSSFAASFNGGAFTSPLLGGPDCTPPLYSFTDATGAGFCLANSSQIQLQNKTATDGVTKFTMGNNAAWNLAAYSIGDANNYGTLNAYVNSGITVQIGSYDNTNSDLSRMEFSSATPDAILTVSATGASSTTTFGTTGTTFTDPIILPTGTAANPALAYSGDADNGIVLGIGTWDLATATSGNPRSYVQLDGNAGTGTPIITIGANDGATDISNFSCSAWSELCQVNVTDGTNSSTATFYDNRTEFSDPVLIPDGTAANPAFAFASDTDYGCWRGGSNNLWCQTSSALPYNYFNLGYDGGPLVLSSQLAASAEYYLLDINPTTDEILVTASKPATGEVANIEVRSAGQVALRASEDSSQANVGERYMTGLPVTLTSATATDVAQVAIPTGVAQVTGFTVDWTVVADDGTDFQSRRGSTYVAAVNKAGTETCVVSDVGTSAFAESAGASTLSVTTACDTSPAQAVDFTINADSSLTETTLEVYFTLRKDDSGASTRAYTY
jgi:hypothetical protein